MTARTALVDKINPRVFYGWVIVAVASLGIFASGPGQSHTFSVFVQPISKDLGISSATIATAYGLATLAAAFLLPKMGKMIDQYGPRRMLFLVTIALGCACLFFGAAANVLWLALGFGLLRFLGQGSLMLGCANLVSQWFAKSRGFAMSLMALGFGISMAVHPPLAEYLLGELGWRKAWFIMGALTWVIMLPPILLFIFNKPEDVGLQPDGDTQADGDDQTIAAVSGLTLKEARGEQAFYILSLGWFLLAMLVTTLHFYQVSILTNQGVSSEAAASAFTISAFTMVAAMPLVGRAFDRFRTKYVFAAALLITSAALWAITLVSTFSAAIVYAVLFGINNAFTMTLFGYIWPRYFGRKHLGEVQGAGQMIGVFGASLGPLPVGLAFDFIGTTDLTIRLLALLPVIAAVIALMFLRTPNAVAGQEHLE
ncbi:MAG: MFS transporter [Hyphomicrobiales bacterium]